MAEKKVIELEVKAESVGSLKSELRKAQAEVAALAEKFGATSKEAINAAKRAAELKDAIGDAKALTDAYNPDAKFNALTQSLGGVLNGFQAFEGALGLVGVESEAVQEQLLKVQSAMALAEGVNGVMESVEAFKNLGAQIKNVTIVQKLLNLAMKANPIGLLIAGITALIAAGAALISWFYDSAAATEKANASMDRHTKALERQERQIARSSKALKDANQYQYDYAEAAGASSEQLRKLAIKHQEEELALAKKNLELAKSTYLREQDILTSYRANDASEELMERQTEIVKKAREATANARQSLEGEYDALKALRRQQKVEIRQEQFDADKEAKDRAKEASEKAQDAAKEQRDRRKEAFEKEKEESQKQADELLAILENRTKQEEDIIRQSEMAKAEWIEKEAERINKLRQEEFKDAIGYLEADLINNENNFQAKRDLLELQREQELSNKELTEGEITAIEAKYAKQRKEINKQEQDLKIQAVQNTLTTIANLAQLFAGASEKEQKKAFEIQKAVGIAQATIDTYKSATAAYSSLAGIPVVGPALGIAAAAAAVTAGLLNVKQIASQEFKASGGGAAGGGSAGVSAPTSGAGGSVISPNFNIVGNAQATNPLAGLGGQPIQAYVVSGEVTTAQSLDRNRINYATFG
jgi:hypothetical protein